MNAEQLYERLKQKNTAAAENALRKGVDIDGFYFEEDGTFLYKAIKYSELEIVRFLLDNGANPNILFVGENALSFQNSEKKEDIEILKLLLEHNVYLYPINNKNQTPIDFFESKEFELEEILNDIEHDLDIAKESNNSYNEVNRLSSLVLHHTEILETTRKVITLLRPYSEENLVKLHIEVSGRNSVFTLQIDKRATIKDLSIMLNTYFFETPLQFDLYYPLFHNKKKRIMEQDRALSDYGLTDGSKLVLIIKVSSERHYEGGKRKTRKIR